jgi:hypothetical protein
MAYREPGVTVTQEFQTAGPSLAVFDLPNVIVGPAYQVVKDDNVGAYAGLAANYSYVSKVAGTIIDTTNNSADLVNYPVRTYLKNAVVTTQDSVSSGAVLIGNLNQFTDATSNVFANVVAGDVIVITGTLAGSYTVRQKINNNTLRVNETFSAAGASLVYTVRRNLGTALVEITSMSGVTPSSANVALPVGLALTVSPYLTVRPVISAEVHLQYRALRFEKSQDSYEYKKVTALQADFGLDQIVPENPVVFAANLALSQGAPAVNITELPQDFLSLPDEVLAYAKAFEVLATTDMYAISVLTQNTAVHTDLKAHCEAMSVPEMKLERVGIANRKIVLTSIVADYTAALASIDATGLILTLASGQFVTDGIVPAMYVNISAPSGAVGRYKIASVDSQTQITLSSAVPSAPYAGNVVFFADRDLTKAQQAATLKAYAQSLGSRRLVLTWPDQVKIPSGNAIRTLPGYFLNAAVGALTTLKPTQQGFTNLTVAGYSEVIHSSKYFDKDQLNDIADGGFMIFVQDVLGVSALKIRHQLTTDRSSIKYQEFSVTKNVDFIAKFLRINHAGFIGQYNIVDTTFDDLKTTAQRNITFLRDSTREPRIGGKIKSGVLASIAEDPVNIDTINEVYNLSIPIPLNNLDITLVV